MNIKAVTIGMLLLVLGGFYTAFWTRATHEFELFASKKVSEEEFREDFRYFRAASRILGVDLFMTPEEAAAHDPSEYGDPGALATRITRGVYMHTFIGVLCMVLGGVFLFKGCQINRSPVPV